MWKSTNVEVVAKLQHASFCRSLIFSIFGKWVGGRDSNSSSFLQQTTARWEAKHVHTVNGRVYSGMLVYGCTQNIEKRTGWSQGSLPSWIPSTKCTPGVQAGSPPSCLHSVPQVLYSNCRCRQTHLPRVLLTLPPTHPKLSKLVHTLLVPPSILGKAEMEKKGKSTASYFLQVLWKTTVVQPFGRTEINACTLTFTKYGVSSQNLTAYFMKTEGFFVD